jgi:hypothetical protein
MLDHSFVNASSKSLEEIISNLKTIPTQKTSHSYATKLEQFSLRLQVSPGCFTQDKSESARLATKNPYALKLDIRFQRSSDKKRRNVACPARQTCGEFIEMPRQRSFDGRLKIS